MTNISSIKPELIVLDLDGTAFNSENVIPYDLKNILVSLIKGNTCRIVLASGRSIYSMEHVIEALDLKAPVITLNGSVIIDPVSHKIYYEKILPLEIYKESIEILKKFKTDFVIFTAFEVYANKPSKITDTLEKYTGDNIIFTDDLSTVRNPVKILYIPKSKDLSLKIKDSTKHMTVDIIESGFNFTEIVLKGENKGSALKMTAKMLGIDKNKIIAFGDNENDIEMLQFAGVGVAMENAPAHVKLQADMVTTTNDNNGVYSVLKNIFTTEAGSS